MLPLLIAEATIWVGFGALLPILPIYFTEHGVDLPMLGVVVAAWPAARLVGEPVFGRIMPFFWVLCAGLLVVTFWATLSLWLPQAFGLVAP